MDNYALSIANYFVRLANSQGRVLRPLKLMKLTYIAHGYMLALLDRNTDGAKLDQVEAWRYGPVFRSVYYAFSHYGGEEIRAEQKVYDMDRDLPEGGELITPCLSDKSERAICDFVWEKYSIYDDSTLVSILHADGTPWSKYYQKGKNTIIPDSETKRYYTLFVQESRRR